MLYWKSLQRRRAEHRAIFTDKYVSKNSIKIIFLCTHVTVRSIAVFIIITPDLNIMSVNLLPLDDGDIRLLSTLLQMCGTL